MSSLFQRWLPLALIGLAALWLRTAELGRRPMHADEANQAVKLGELIDSGHYAFDPRDHHGPTLYYAALPLAWLRGETTLASLTEITVRLVPALAGTLAVLLLAALAWPARQSGRPDKLEQPETGVADVQSRKSSHWPALAAAAFLAVSPPAVYYSRYFIQETLLVTFTLGTLVCAQRWWRHGHLAWAVAAGVCAGLMQATKASAPVFVLAAALALLAARPGKPAAARPGRDLALAALAILAVTAAFYSSLGTHLGGLRDALAVYGPAWQKASEGAGHEKPWWYYLQLFTWQRNGGLLWEQVGFTALALAGAGVALLPRQGFLRWGAAYTGFIFLTLSLTPYKTPWHAIHLVPGLALLAAGALAALPRWWFAGLVAATALACQWDQTRLVAFSRPADLRNPYAYVHSSPDVLKFRALAETALARDPTGIVRVIGEEYWPLPWYFRGLPHIGYWSTPPEECDGALLIVTATQADAVRARLHGGYGESYLGLRPGVLCVVFTPRP